MALHRSPLLYFLLSLICVLLLTPSVTAQHATFNKSYGGPGDDAASGIVATSDGGYLVVGYTTSYGPNPGAQTPNGHVLRLDSEGQVIWRRSYGGQANDHLTGVTILPNGEYLAVGNYDFTGNPNTAQVWLSRITDDGTLVWNKRLGSTSRVENGNLVFAMENGDCMIAGTSRQSSTSTNSDILLMKVDIDGQLIWSATYGSPVRESPNAMLLLEDGGILIAGFRYVIPISEGFLLKIDSNGNLLWDLSYALPGQSIGFTGLVSNGNDGYIAASSNGLLGLDGDGNILWSREYAPMNGDELNLKDVIQADPGRFLVLATRNDQALTSFSMAAFTIDPTGNLMATQQYAQDPARGFGDLAIYNQNGGFTLLGRIVEEDFNIHVVRTWADAGGLQAGCHSQELQVETIELPAITSTSPYQQFSTPPFTLTTMGMPPANTGNESIYCSNVGLPPVEPPTVLTLHPVPASDRLHLGDALPAGPLAVELVDASGRTLLRHERLLERTLDIRAVTDGAYVCRVIMQDGTHAVARFLVVR